MVAAARAVLILAFGLSLAGAFGLHEGRRWFWTVAIASLPWIWLVGGFHLWRRICPLASMSRLGQLLGRPGPRRIQGAWSEHAVAIQLSLLTCCLMVRHLGANGSPGVLTALVGIIIAAAMLVGARYTGKTWCNFVCPVGAVERIYCEPVRGIGLGPKDSRCHPCTACKKDCPDIDVEQEYWKQQSNRSRRLAYYAWPGIVIGFYLYFYLRTGDWDFYWSGSWGYESDLPSRLGDSGLFFATGIPLALAAPLTLLVCGGASAGLFFSMERLGLLAHRAMSLASAAGLLGFYTFAGQPAIRTAPGWVARLVDVLVIGALAAVLVRRWPRSDADFVEERYANKLLRAERRKEQKTRVDAYRDTVVELVADGVLARKSVGALTRLRAQLSIADAEHEQIMRQAVAPSPAGSTAQTLAKEAQALEVLGHAIAAAESVDPEGSSASLQLLRRACTWRAAQRIAGLKPAIEEIAQEAEKQAALSSTTATFESARSQLPTDPAASFRALCNDDHVVVRSAALFVLGRYSSAADKDTAIRATDDDEAIVRETAYRVLAAQGGLSKELRTKARADDDGRVRGAVLRGTDRALEATVDPHSHMDRLTRIERIIRIAQVPLFADLSPDDLEIVADMARDQTFAPGQALCRAGDADQQVYVLTDGSAAISRSQDGSVQHLGTVESGACVGELAALDSAPRSADVIALIETRALAIDGGDFRSLMARRPQLAERVMAVMAQRLRSAMISR